MEPPSNQLTQTLKQLGLCHPRQLRRCRSQVKRLARDLPAFDSVWIDALLKNRQLTPFQAACLESDHPQQLAVGTYLLVDLLKQGKQSMTYLATDRQTKKHVVINRSPLIHHQKNLTKPCKI